MGMRCNRMWPLRYPIVTILFGCLLSACTVVGPATVRSGRLAYNEAITETDNQQMLLLAVRNRYGERSNLLAVTSVTANVRVTTNASIEAGVGDSDNFAGNLVPFGAGFVYEENPTISYTPVGGQRYMHLLMSPVSLASLAQLADHLTDPAPVYYALVSGINGIYNPDFLSPASAPDARFVRVVTIMTELARAHRLRWAQDPRHKDRFSIVIDHYSPVYSDQVDELLTLLELSAPENGSSPITLPVSLALAGQGSGGINVTTRSVFDLLEILSGAVEIPEQDLASGVAVRYPRPGPLGEQLQVRYAAAEPGRASVAVKHRDGWFYIDDQDQPTKQFFRLLSTLLSVKIAESTGRTPRPVLTLPVSR